MTRNNKPSYIEMKYLLRQEYCRGWSAIESHRESHRVTSRVTQSGRGVVTGKTGLVHLPPHPHPTGP